MSFIKSYLVKNPSAVAGGLVVLMAMLLLTALVIIPTLRAGAADKPILIVEEMFVGGETLQKVFPGDVLREEIPSHCQIRAEPGYYIGWNSPKERGCRFEHKDTSINLDLQGGWHLIVYDEDGYTVHEYDFVVN